MPFELDLITLLRSVRVGDADKRQAGHFRIQRRFNGDRLAAAQAFEDQAVAVPFGVDWTPVHLAADLAALRPGWLANFQARKAFIV